MMQLAEPTRNSEAQTDDDLPQLRLSSSQVGILSDLTQSALNQEKKLLQDVAQVIGQAERSMMPLNRKNRLAIELKKQRIESGQIKSSGRSFQAKEVDKYQNILTTKMESFKASMRR